MSASKAQEKAAIDWERYKKMSLAEKLAYLNEKTRELDEKIKKLLY